MSESKNGFHSLGEDYEPLGTDGKVMGAFSQLSFDVEIRLLLPLNDFLYQMGCDSNWIKLASPDKAMTLKQSSGKRAAAVFPYRVQYSQAAHWNEAVWIWKVPEIDGDVAEDDFRYRVGYMAELAARERAAKQSANPGFVSKFGTIKWYILDRVEEVAADLQKRMTQLQAYSWATSSKAMELMRKCQYQYGEWKRDFLSDEPQWLGRNDW
jgi:hypothetical protein